MKSYVSLVVLAAMITFANTCSMPRGWKPQNIAKRARRADMVVFGKVLKSPEKWQIHETKLPGKMSLYSYKQLKISDMYTAELEVYCIIKGEDLPRFVNASGFGWRAGHCVNTPAIEGEKAIFFLTRGDFGELTVHEVNVQLASETSTEKNLLEVLRATHMIFHTPKLPIGVKATLDRQGCPRIVMNKT